MSIDSVMLSSHFLFCCPLFLFALNLSQHQYLFHKLAFCIRRPKYWSFSNSPPNNIQAWFPLGLTDLRVPCTERRPRVFFSTTIWKHQFFDAQPSSWSKFRIHMWLLGKPYDYMNVCWSVKSSGQLTGSLQMAWASLGQESKLWDELSPTPFPTLHLARPRSRKSGSDKGNKCTQMGQEVLATRCAIIQVELFLV